MEPLLSFLRCTIVITFRGSFVAEDGSYLYVNFKQMWLETLGDNLVHYLHFAYFTVDVMTVQIDL